MIPTAWRDDDVATAKRLWNAGMTAAEIGRLLGRTKGAVCGLAERNRGDFPKRAGRVAVAVAAPQVDRGSRRGDWTPADDAEMTRLRLEHGRTYAEIGEALGRTEGAVESRAGKLGLRRATARLSPRGGRREWTDGYREEVRRLRLQGMGARQIARRLGLDESTVGKTLRSMGLMMGASERSMVGSIAARGKSRQFPVLPLPTRAPVPIPDPVPFPAGVFRCWAPAWPDNLARHEVSSLAKSGELMCCGHPVKDGKTLCAAHYARFYTRVTPAGERVRITRPSAPVEAARAPA